jgi:hypothetical protein
MKAEADVDLLDRYGLGGMAVRKKIYDYENQNEWPKVVTTAIIHTSGSEAGGDSQLEKVDVVVREYALHKVVEQISNFTN